MSDTSPDIVQGKKKRGVRSQIEKDKSHEDGEVMDHSIVEISVEAGTQLCRNP